MLLLLLLDRTAVARCEIGGRGLKLPRLAAQDILERSPAVKLAGVD